MPNDVWHEFSRVCGTFKERQGWHPCQMPESLLTRIIAVSSNPGDCVLDPFSGSGTTAAAACQLARNYVGVEISDKYVENTEKRLAGLKKQSQCVDSSLFFNSAELNELKRLLSDMERPLKEIADDENLLELFTNQFAIRMNNQKRYSAAEIAATLGSLTD